MGHDIRYLINFELRRILAGTPLGALARRVKARTGNQQWHRNPAFWDSALLGQHSDYLAGTDVELRAAIIGTLARNLAPETRSVLDLGCAAGGLFRGFASFKLDLYHGVDISKVAVDQARAKYAPAENPKPEFFPSDLCSFMPPANARYDLIAFSEVLYYLSVQEACEQVVRYEAFLRPKGIMCISMKNDPKSFSIFDFVLRHRRCLYSTLLQYSPGELCRRIVIRPQNPAIIITFFAGAAESARER